MMSAAYKCDVCGKLLDEIFHYNSFETSEFVGKILVRFIVSFNQWKSMGICEECARKKIKEAARELKLQQ